ncbi:MAG: hypothetical protein ABSC41_14430 [Acidimicrobiales bacterium]
MLIATLSLTMLATACSSGATAGPTTEAPLPAGPTPSTIAKMVCRFEAIQDINSAIGEQAKVSTPTWADHLYSCRYEYPTGSMVLSVKELSSWSQTKAYFEQLGRQLGKARTIQALGQGAFQTTNGSMVVRKDWKVLLVDTEGLPAQFGQPPTSSGDVAVTVADVILGCWSGD